MQQQLLSLDTVSGLLSMRNSYMQQSRVTLLTEVARRQCRLLQSVSQTTVR